MKKKKLMATVVFVLSTMALLASCGGGGGEGGGGGGSTSQSANYTITVKAPDGVTLTGLPEGGTAVEGQRITFKIQTTGNVVIESVTYNGTELRATSTGTYRFAMPAENVTIEVKISSVTDIEIDTTEVKKNFIVGSTFSTKGLVVNALLAGGTKEEIKTGYEVSTPDLTKTGTQEVSITYGGFTKKYEIKVGDLKADDADINQVDSKVVFSVLGNFSGFSSASELTLAAANGDYLMDFQYNNNIGGMGWDRPYENNNIQFASAGEGRFKADIDVTNFQGAGGAGIGYTFHFGLPQADGGDAGNASDLKLEATTEHDNKEIVIGTKTYKLTLNVGIGDDGSKFWGCIGLIVIDTAAPFVRYDHATLLTDDNTVKLQLSGSYRGYSQTDVTNEAFYVDVMQFGSWTKVCEPDFNPAVLSLGAPSIITNVGTFTQTIDLTGQLDTIADYFIHYGPIKGNDRSNLTWMDDADAMEAIDPSNAGVVSLFKVTGYTASSDTWRNGLLGLSFLGGDYVMPKSVDLVKDGDKAIFQVKGIYSGISNKDNDAYYLDCMDFTSNTDISNEGADTTLAVTPESSGATSGTFVLSLDVTGKLTAGEGYYCHFGPLPDGATYRNNLTAGDDFEAKEVVLAGGKYTLTLASGYSGNDDSWRNGLPILTFIPAN